MDNNGAPVMQLELIYDKIDSASAIYKWKLNDQVSDKKTMQVSGDGPVTGYVKIKSTEDECFLYKEIEEVFDFSDCCDYLGDDDYLDIAQQTISCNGSDVVRNLYADFKGPANMELEYYWDIDGETSNERRFTITGTGTKTGTLMVSNPIDGCYITKDVIVEFQRNVGFLGNQVWIDSNSEFARNTFDIADERASDIKVSLYSYPDMKLITSTITDENGIYLFEELYGGEYVIKVDIPENMIPVMKYEGQDDSADSNINPDGFSDPFTLDGCDADWTIDAGLKRH